MAERSTPQIWMRRMVFISVALMIVFLQLLPLDTIPGQWAAPDFLLACTLAWVSRRPDFLPVYIIAAIFLLTDLLFQRPPGLWTALVIILTEILRVRARNMRSVPIAVELGAVAIGIIGITVANRVILAIVMTPQAPLGLTLIQMLMTIAIYPVVLFAAQYVFGIARTTPGQTNSYGHRI
ncbi:rod shape-determining protein MreD [Yoonia sp. 208BN28-4]|uniref:rod shape-determining protein MreD n=1 Tax=Yoonia sp. 208BN28-4 TaxID=3126505 RepID=UPI0030AE407B